MTADNGMVEIVPAAVVILCRTVAVFRDECRQYGVDSTDPSFHVVAKDGLPLSAVVLLDNDTPWVAIGDDYDKTDYSALRFRFGHNVRFPDAVTVINQNIAWRKDQLWRK